MAPKIKVEDVSAELTNIKLEHATNVKREECHSSSFMSHPVPRKAGKRSKASNGIVSGASGEPDSKRIRPNSMDDGTGIVVVVGGKEFLEDSHSLACSAVLQDMVKNGNRRIEFGSEKDPEEWAMVRQLLDPFSEARITKDNLKTALLWFDYLKIAKGIAQCDDVLDRKVIPFSLPLKRSKYNNDIVMTASDMDEILEHMPLAFNFELPTSKQKCLDITLAVLKESPFWLGLGLIEKIVSLVLTYQGCNNCLLQGLLEYVPSANTLPVGDLLHNPLFPLVILNGVQRKAEGKDKLGKMKRDMDRVLDVITGMNPRTTVTALKKALKKDKACKRVIAKKW